MIISCSSAPSNSVIELVVDPAIMAIRVDSLSLATECAWFAKPEHGTPASSQCSLKIKSACYSVPSNSVIEPVVDPAIIAIWVDSLSLATERDRLGKPKHGTPASSQRSLKIKSAFCSVLSNSVSPWWIQQIFLRTSPRPDLPIRPLRIQRCQKICAYRRSSSQQQNDWSQNETRWMTNLLGSGAQLG